MRTSILVLALATLGILSGCEKKPADKPVIEVNAPGVEVKVDKEGAEVKAPGVDVESKPGEGAEVKVGEEPK